MRTVVLVRHGEAKSKEEDPERGLTEKGAGDAERVADFAAASGVEVSRVIHSGKLRAAETAAIFAVRLGAEGAVEAADGLAPMDDPGVWAERLDSMEGDGGRGVVLVGHLPHMGRLATLLACGGGDGKAVTFEPATACCLERDDEGRWAVRWLVSPRGLGGH